MARQTRRRCHHLGVDAERTLEVPADGAGERLDAYLAKSLGLSRRAVTRLIDAGQVRLLGRRAAKGAMLRAGDRIRVAAFRAADEGPIPEPGRPLVVLARAAVDKPAGPPTHPLAPGETGTVLNAVVARFPEMVGVGEGGLRSGVVHRLDLGTSGALVFATEEAAWQRARRAFAERRVEKIYVARVHGEIEGEHDVELVLAHRGDHMRVVTAGGRATRTLLRALVPGRETSLVEARPITGMMHQIRVTLAHLGHPVVGDRLYGSTVELERHLLHATQLRIDEFQASSVPPPELADRP
jgi:23S rRNA pseudouridine1911/1915/1917 synthase